jgi:hypothetical protein
MNYYYTADGTNVLGPIALDQLTNLFSQGGLPATTQVCAEGTQTWQPIATILPVGSAPPPPPAPPPIPQTGDATGGLIPYKNPQALVAYYLGIFGLFPAIGFFLAIPAFILGILGLKKRKLNPIIKGAVHAWIGIILGAISIACHLLVVALLILGRKH